MRDAASLSHILPLRPARSMAVTTSILVFVVEDQDYIQHLLEETLTDGGFTVTMASSCEEAIAMLDREGADYRALITDIHLSGKLTGWDVARHAREVNDKLPVIYMTGADVHDWASKGVPNSQLIVKPFTPAQIVTAVAQLINDAAGL
jgi:DNA-binding NtrC family response regulator